MNKRKVLGFTLVELMIVVAIVAILSAVAYPQYSQHLRKGRRAQAQAFLMDMAAREQQYLTDARAYAVDSGGVPAYTTLKMTLSTDVSNYYTITTTTRSTAVSSTPSFTITATAYGDQLKDKQSGITIKSLTIDDTGAKKTIDTSNNSYSSVAW